MKEIEAVSCHGRKSALVLFLAFITVALVAISMFQIVSDSRKEKETVERLKLLDQIHIGMSEADVFRIIGKKPTEADGRTAIRIPMFFKRSFISQLLSWEFETNTATRDIIFSNGVVTNITETGFISIVM